MDLGEGLLGHVLGVVAVAELPSGEGDDGRIVGAQEGVQDGLLDRPRLRAWTSGGFGGHARHRAGASSRFAKMSPTSALLVFSQPSLYAGSLEVFREFRKWNSPYSEDRLRPMSGTDSRETAAEFPHHAPQQPGRPAGCRERAAPGTPGTALPGLLEARLRLHPPDLVRRPREGPGSDPGLLRVGLRQRLPDQVDPACGNFPDVPQSVLRNFVREDHRRTSAAKRGGGIRFVTMDDVSGTRLPPPKGWRPKRPSTAIGSGK